MNIDKLFRERGITLGLYDLIMEKKIGIEEEMLGIRKFFIQNRLLSLSLAINFYTVIVIFWDFLSTSLNDRASWGLIWVIIFFVIMLFPLAGFLYGLVQNWRFEKYYNAFISHFDFWDFSEIRSYDGLLETWVCNRLRYLAQQFEEIEKKYGKMNTETSEARKRLSDAHAFFLQLNLCKDKWDTYFDKSGDATK